MGAETKGRGATASGLPRLLTATDLAERWSCAESTVLDLVNTAGLPFISIGATPKRSRPGQKNYRFRLADVEQWEEQRRMVWNNEPTPAPAKTVGTVPGWDGIFRGGRKKK